jgi:hypothetical protein
VTSATFGVAEAEATLPMLRELLPRVRGSRRALVDASDRITAAVAADGGGTEGSEWFRAQRTLREDLTTLAELGILLRDPESGLVDFPSELEGRRVFLCWQLGEERVAWYHDEHAGFTNRRPL